MKYIKFFIVACCLIAGGSQVVFGQSGNPTTSVKFVMKNGAGNTITLATPTTGVTNYALTFPPTVGGTGSMLYTSNATGILSWLAAGTTGQVLTINGSGIPAWASITTPLATDNIFVGNASNIATAVAPGGAGTVLSIVGTTPTWSNAIGGGTNKTFNINFTGGNDTTNISNPTSITNIFGTVNIPGLALGLTKDNVFVGNASNNAAQVPPGAAGTVLSIVGTTPTWSTSLGSSSTVTTNVQGITTNINTSNSPGTTTNIANGSVNPTGNAQIFIGAGPTGNGGTTTTFGGNVNFTNPVTLTQTLATDNIFRGVAGVATAYAPGAAGTVLSIVGTTPTWSTTLGGGGLTTNISNSGGPNTTNINNSSTGGTTNIGNATSTTNFFGTVNIPGLTLGLTKDNVFVGNASNNAAQVPPGAAGTVLTIVGTTPTWSNSIGSTTTTTSIIGNVTNFGTTNSATNNFGTGTTAINTIGNNTGPSVTTLNGTVIFNNTPSIPLTKDNIFVGNASNKAAAVPPGAAGTVLGIVGTTPTWSTTLGSSSTVTTNVQGITTNINTSNSPGTTTNIANGPVNPTGNAQIFIGAGPTGNGGTTTTFGGNVNFTNPVTLTQTLATDNIFRGVAGVATAYAPGAAGTVLTIVGTTPTWSNSIGSTTTTTSIIGNVTNFGTTNNATNNFGTGTTAINTIGNNTGPSVTTLNGTVIFNNTPSIPLATDNIFRGVAGIATAYAPGTAGQVLTIVGTTPTWGTTIGGNTTTTNISNTGTNNTTNINNTSTGGTTNIGNNTSTTNLYGTVNIPNLNIGLTKDNIFVGNASNNAAAVAPGAAGTVLTIVGTTPTWSTPTGSFWTLTGNPTSTAWNGTSGSFLGTTTTQPLVIATTNTTTAQPIELFTNNTERMRIAPSGYVGIGYKEPKSILHVASQEDDDATNDVILSTYNNTANNGGEFVTQRSRGTIAAPTNVASGDDLGGYKYRGYYNGSFIEAGQMDFIADAAPSASGIANHFVLNTSNGSAMTQRLYINSAGLTAIGTQTPNTQLDVDGAASLRPATSNITATSTITVGNRSYLRITHDGNNGTYTMTLSDGLQDGQVLIIQVEGVQATPTSRILKFDSGTNLKLSGSFAPNTIHSTLSLIWDGSEWVETARSTN